MTPPDPPRVVGRYEIVRQLGHGGMATVHLARQHALDREVALKELHPAHAADAAFAHRFLNESRVAGALNHPSVVSVIEYFEHDGVPFIAMEYLERGSLRPLVGRLTLAHVAGVLEGVLGGLAEAASQGIVHRDLKPENVLLTADGHAKVADFGIAKALGQVQMTELRTAAGHVVGTPAYMAPEQVMGGEITAQTDLYATGLIAYELLAGRHPYEGVDAPMALMLRHANDEPPPLAALREDLPPGVVAWVHAMLAKDPAARPASAAHAWDWLEGVVADELGARWRRAAALPEAGEQSGYVSVVTAAVPVTAPRYSSAVLPVVAADNAAPTLAAPDMPWRRRRRRPSRRRRTSRTNPLPPPPNPAAPAGSPLLAGVAATLVLAAGAAGFSLASGEEPPAAAAPAQGPVARRAGARGGRPCAARQPAGHRRADAARPRVRPGRGARASRRRPPGDQDRAGQGRRPRRAVGAARAGQLPARRARHPEARHQRRAPRRCVGAARRPPRAHRAARPERVRLGRRRAQAEGVGDRGARSAAHSQRSRHGRRARLHAGAARGHADAHPDARRSRRPRPRRPPPPRLRPRKHQPQHLRPRLRERLERRRSRLESVRLPGA